MYNDQVTHVLTSNERFLVKQLTTGGPSGVHTELPDAHEDHDTTRAGTEDTAMDVDDEDGDMNVSVGRLPSHRL